MMNRFSYIIAAGSVAFLVGCEPLPPNPPPRYGSYAPNFPPGSQGGGQGQNQQYPPGGHGFEQGDDRFDFPGGGESGRPTPRDQYPMAEKTANPNQVLSPYAPYNVIDVEGFRSGQLAKDPSNGKIFRVP